ncbi:hypothetical protein M8C21_023888, partial [Ambrosia artemisiifolia]
ERFGLDLTQKQMKNAYDNLKAKYTGWVYLKNKTGNIYNAQTNTFTLTNEEWEEFKKGHPKAGSLKKTLCTIVDGNAATGMHKWTSTQTSVVGSSSCHRPKPLLIMDTVLHDIEDDAADTGHQTFEPTPEPTPDPISKPTPEHTTQRNPKKKAKFSKSSTFEDELARDMQKALQYWIKSKEGPTVVECSDKLMSVGLNPIDPLFLAAYNIFGQSADMRAAWMALPEIPDVLKGWIAMTATSSGLIKIIMDYDKKLLIVILIYLYVRFFGRE